MDYHEGMRFRPSWLSAVKAVLVIASTDFQIKI